MVRWLSHRLVSHAEACQMAGATSFPVRTQSSRAVQRARTRRQALCRRRTERSMRAAASENNPANPIAGIWLAVFGSFGAAAGAGAGAGAAAAAARGAGAGAAGRVSAVRRRSWAGDDRHQLERRHIEFTKVVRVLAGFPLESAGDLHPAAERRIRDVALSPGYRSSGHRHRGRPCTMPLVRWQRALSSGAPARTCPPFRRAPHCHEPNIPPR